MAARPLVALLLPLLASSALAPAVLAQGQPLAGSIVHHRKISQTEGGFTGVLQGGEDPLVNPGDLFGISVAPLGDVDGDGIGDLAVGAHCDDEGGLLTGAVWILFLNADQTVRTQQKISKFQGNFPGPIDKGDLFGWSACGLGDLDGDGRVELAVGGWLDDDGADDQGAVWILSLNPDGTVFKQQKISATHGGFTGWLDPGERFGTSLVNLGDLDRDGVTDLAAGAIYDQQGGHLVGAMWILFLNPDGTVREHGKITNGVGGFSDFIDPYSRFSYSACNLGDLDGDGVADLAVGAITEVPNWAIYPEEEFGCHWDCGAVWILFLNTDGTVKHQQRVGEGFGGFTGTWSHGENFAHGVASPGDLDGDGVQDLFVGSVGHESDFPGGPVTGTIWVLFLNTDGTVKSHRKIDAHEGGFTGELAIADFFGQSIAALGDLDGDGIGDVVTGAIGDDDGGPDKGAVWFLYPYGPRWSEAGPGTAGGAGVPKLSVSSSLAAGAPLVMRLEKSVANAPLLLFVSVAGLPLPLKGGTLWPSLSAPHAAVALWTGRSGKIQIPTIVPPGWPAGLELWMQAWIKDAAGAGGFASTNAIIGTAP